MSVHVCLYTTPRSFQKFHYSFSEEKSIPLPLNGSKEAPHSACVQYQWCTMPNNTQRHRTSDQHSNGQLLCSTAKLLMQLPHLIPINGVMWLPHSKTHRVQIWLLTAELAWMRQRTDMYVTRRKKNKTPFTTFPFNVSSFFKFSRHLHHAFML